MADVPVFREDAVAAALHSGARPPTTGLNLNLASPPPMEMKEPYMSFSEELALALKHAPVYIYPFYALHVTAASPIPFTACKLASHEIPRYQQAWKSALRKVSTLRSSSVSAEDPVWPVTPFPLVFETVQLESNAAFFRIRDDTGSVATVRKCIERAAAFVASEYEDMGVAESADADRSASVLGRAGFKVPGIIHSTFMRFIENANAEESILIREKFNAVAAKWRPVTVMVDSLLLVDEAVPYMHLHLDGCDSDKVLATYKFETVAET